MKDNTNTLSIEAKLTRLGKKRLSENRFNPTKFALSDDGINYGLKNTGLSNEDIALLRTPLFNVSRDSTSLIKSKLLRSSKSEERDVNYDFDIEIRRPNNDAESILEGGVPKEVKYPVFENGDMKRIKYYIPRGEIARSQHNSVIRLSLNNLVGQSMNGLFTVFLHDSKYFDISLTTQTVHDIQGFSNNYNIVDRNMPESVVIQNVNSYTDVPKVINTRIFVDPPVAPSNELYRRTENFVRSQYNTFSDLSYDEIGLENQNISGAFNLFYKGNFGYKDTSTGTYDTIITIFSEQMGYYENIHLSIIPTQNV